MGGAVNKTGKSVKKRNTYHHGDLKKSLVHAALQFIAQGQDFSIRDLASKLGVSHTAAYAHFRNKEALFAAMAEEGFGLLRAALTTCTEGAETALERFRRQGFAYVNFAVAHPGHYRVMFGDHVRDRSAYPELVQAGDATKAELENALAACQREGSLGAGDVAGMALATWSMVHGLASLLLNGQLGSDVSVEDLQKRAGTVLAFGLQAGLPEDI